MPAPYSLDLRQKALAALEAGHSQAAVSRLMGISRTTLSEWHHRYRVHSEVAAKPGDQHGHSHPITDGEEFRTFADTHGDKTPAEMAQLWPEAIGENTMARALQRIGFTRKSGATPRRSPALGNAPQDKELSLSRKAPEKRPADESELAQYEPPQRGDLDEAGLNNTEDDAYGWGPKGQRFAAERRSNRTEQVSFMAAWHQHQLVAPLTEEGDCHRAVFETWL